MGRILGLLLLFFMAGQAAAHPAPFSYLDVRLDAGRIHGAIVLHDFDVGHELRLDQPQLLLDPVFAARAREPVVALLARGLRLAADGKTLRPAWGAIEVLDARESVRLPFTIDAPTPARLDVEARLFAYDTSHQTFVNIYEQGELHQQSILDARRAQASFYSGTPQGRWAVIRTFAQAGIQHIVIGPDHILFLFALLLLGGSWWRLAAIVTAFTIGHSITLSLAALEMVRISPRIIEPAIALSIIVVGVDTWLVNRERGRDLRPWMAGAFGLIHGFGFASALIEFGLPREALGWSLAAFNTGVEIGQLVIVLALLGLGRAVTSMPFHTAGFRQRFVPLAAIAVSAAGLYWFIERTIFAPSA